MPGHFCFYTENISDTVAWFNEQETKHAIQVLRFNLGDSIEFTDGNGFLYTGKILSIEKNRFSAEITQKNQRSPLEITICVGKLKSSDRMEWLVEKCTEIGIQKLAILQTKNVERSFINIEKLKKTAIAALKQSHGSNLPDIVELNFSESLLLPGEKYIAACKDSESQIIPEKFKRNSVIYIGPEGDFTEQEIEMAISQGAQLISLGKTVLRTETAALVCAAKSIV